MPWGCDNLQLPFPQREDLSSLNATNSPLRHREYGAKLPLKICSKSVLYPANKPGGLRQMLSDLMMDDHLNPGELLHQITSAASVVHVDMGQGDIGEGFGIMTQLPQPLKNRGSYDSRSGLNERWSFIGDKIDHRTWPRHSIPGSDLIHIFGNLKYLGHVSADFIPTAYGTLVHFNINK